MYYVAVVHQHGTKNRCHGNGQKIDRLSADSDEVEEDGRAATTPYSISFAAWHSLLGAILTVNDNIRRPEKDDVLAGKAAYLAGRPNTSAGTIKSSQ